ncbi:MAG: hypothetical protein KKA19_06115, partial [Candidatus Margulisbacteria bacterium]|nr:hypothetical protein [Candidatus Margulisiibacteriota bacterium]
KYLIKDLASFITGIVAVADSFEAMTSRTRVYRNKMPAHKIIDELEKSYNKQWCQPFVEVLLKYIKEKKDDEKDYIIHLLNY